ncbi:hypothetical protein BRC62_05105 [Halobacteriales archaeon QH_10_67_13]|nr:MAG: hypothetical protein BRC62_05105 [Halobacteriales archaeon QH_10_67_13]
MTSFTHYSRASSVSVWGGLAVVLTVLAAVALVFDVDALGIASGVHASITPPLRSCWRSVQA